MKSAKIPAKFNPSLWTHVHDLARAPVLAEAINNAASHANIVLLPQYNMVEMLLGELDFFLNKLNNLDDQFEILPLPVPVINNAEEPLPERLREERECDRIAALTALALYSGEPLPAKKLIILTTPDALFAPTPPKEFLESREIRFATGDKIQFEELQRKLAEELDYDAEAVCERPGQFAVRGGLIDIYPLNGTSPIRLDFFGDEIESIRTFDPTNQRSQNALQSIIIAGRTENSPPERGDYIFDYFGKDCHWILVEAESMTADSPYLFAEFEKLRDKRASFGRLIRERKSAGDQWTCIQDFDTVPAILPAKPNRTICRIENLNQYREQPLETTLGIERLEAETSAREDFFSKLAAWQKESCDLVGVLPNQGKVEEVQNLLKESPRGKKLNVHFISGELRAGLLLARNENSMTLDWIPGKSRRIALITEREWLGRHIEKSALYRRRKLPHRTQVDQLLDFSELADGDYLVHLSHGICIFRGITQMDIHGKQEEVISLEFDEKLTLHVPLYESHLLTRYVGLSKVAPKLGKLGTNNWSKTRKAAEEATLDFAAKLLSLQALREEGTGYAFPPDNDWQFAFENAFPYRETPDQKSAIQETKANMEEEKAMDRLICGDVGFGKTEVAIRAAFKAVLDGFQVAILVPTTILAQQHYQTFSERFAAYPVTVEMLSRFRSSRQQKEIVRQTHAGKLDILIGTHRLLGKDVGFKNLGLLVIDEEHRFGVRHKERLKEMRAHVDILTMSATPIPRTLYLALMGARDLSVIETPPEDRLPIETIVRQYDPDLVKRAIQRELDRDGQVFYLHNRVETIQSVAARLNEMIPDARIAVGHGQMTEHSLEKVMTDFVAKKYDVLVCTTIIENGLDIPNCNTIIIEGADRFGLSQLYQLRGRVGRFKRQAYAYLLLHRHTHMIDLAHKRLSAMHQHNQLGAGFKIAMRDLELRGAGNLLGPQQSGHIAGVGFDLYCSLLRQSVSRLKGEDQAARIRASLNLDFIQLGMEQDDAPRATDFGFKALHNEDLEAGRIAVQEAYIPQKFIRETRLRIDFYRRLALGESLEEVRNLEEELRDRFGEIPSPVNLLLAVTRIRVQAEISGIRSVETEGNRLKCLRATAKQNDFIKVGNRFPRLTTNRADLRLREIEQFLSRQSHRHK